MVVYCVMPPSSSATVNETEQRQSSPYVRVEESEATNGNVPPGEFGGAGPTPPLKKAWTSGGAKTPHPAKGGASLPRAPGRAWGGSRVPSPTGNAGRGRTRGRGRGFSAERAE